MRWLLNSILVLTGVPLVGVTLMVIGSFAPPMKDDFNRSERLCLLGLWAAFFALFVLAYAARSRWLQRRGIYESWSNFEAYMKENHGPPRVPEGQKTDFFSWAGLPTTRPAEFRKTVKALYGRIHAEIDSQEKKESYIRWLARYASPWPVHEDCYDPYGDDN